MIEWLRLARSLLSVLVIIKCGALGTHGTPNAAYLAAVHGALGQTGI